MPRRSPIQVGSQSYDARAGFVTAERVENMYIEPSPQGAKGPFTAYSAPGLKRWETVGLGPIRGMLGLTGGDLYVVSGPDAYRVSGGNVTLLGRVGSAGAVRMTENGTHVIAATRDRAYAINATDIVELPEGNFNGATYQDGYGILTQAGTLQYWLTGLDDATTIDGLDFETADAFPDLMMGCIAASRRLWLFKQRSSEIHYNAGRASFPFVRIQGGVIERGCAASGSIAKDDQTVYWLGDNLRVYAARGLQPQPISTPPIERHIATRENASGCEAFVTTIEGRTFYTMLFSDATLQFDSTTGLWSERFSQNMNRWRVSCYTEFQGMRLVGDSENGDIHELVPGKFDENGAELIRRITFPPIHANGLRVFHHELFLDCLTGEGLDGSVQGSAPEAVLEWSDDGGVTFSGGLRAPLGPIGSRDRQVFWNRLGSFRQRTLRVSVSDPVPLSIVGAYANLEVGT